MRARFAYKGSFDILKFTRKGECVMLFNKGSWWFVLQGALFLTMGFGVVFLKGTVLDITELVGMSLSAIFLLVMVCPLLERYPDRTIVFLTALTTAVASLVLGAIIVTLWVPPMPDLENAIQWAAILGVACWMPATLLTVRKYQ